MNTANSYQEKLNDTGLGNRMSASLG